MDWDLLKQHASDGASADYSWEKSEQEGLEDSAEVVVESKCETERCRQGGGIVGSYRGYEPLVDELYGLDYPSEEDESVQD